MRYHYDPAGFLRQFAGGLPASDRALVERPEVAAAFERAMEETLRQGPYALAHDVNPTPAGRNGKGWGGRPCPPPRTRSTPVPSARLTGSCSRGGAARC